MKFILMMGMKTDAESNSKGIMTWPKEDIQAHIDFMMSFNKELKEAGELVSAEGLAWPDQAKLVRAGNDGTPITDGVFPESKEFLIGYWIIDVETSGTRLSGGGARVGGARAGRCAPQYADRSAADHERAAGRICVIPSARFEDLLRELAPQVLGALVRRFRDFASAEDAVQEALLAADKQWPRRRAT